MKETSFIEQNKEKWKRFEKMQDAAVSNPEELSDLYMDLTDDLSYAQTFYKRRTVRVYLNQLAQKVFSGVHKQKGDTFRKLINVWKTSLPLEIYRSRKNLNFAFICFLIYAAIGVISSQMIPNFENIILGDEYIKQTNANIKAGNPLKIYEDTDQLQMFIRITTNNLKVSFLTFFVGFFFTIGTHIMLFYNGVMLGAFQNFFYMKGLLITSFLGIWIHGAFEISSIVLAGGAGITAGHGWLFPQSYTRMQSLQLSTKRGLKIMLSIVPFIIIAGFLESYVTANYQNLSDWSKWLLILLSFGIILSLYVIYPIYVARKHPHLVAHEDSEIKPKNTSFNLEKIRSLGEIVSDTFRFYNTQFYKIGKVIFAFILPISLLLIYLQDINHYQEMKTEYWYDWVCQLKIIFGYGYKNTQDLVVLFIWTFVFAFVNTTIYWSFYTQNESFSWKSFFQFSKKKYISIWLGSVLIFIALLVSPWYVMILAILFISFFALLSPTLVFDNASLKNRIKKGFSFSKNHFGNTLLLFILIIGFIALIAQPFGFVFSIYNEQTQEPLVMSDLLDVLADFTKRIAKIYTADYMVISNGLRQFVYIIFILCVLPLTIIAATFGYFSELEKSEAIGLKKQFEKFGKRNRFIETEEDFE
ncbi:MAG: stage II sporulation protein M [Flavobacteriia bacterium]|nr:stage II sporulation protein M [Flavobacteriia bacterium]